MVNHHLGNIFWNFFQASNFQQIQEDCKEKESKEQFDKRDFKFFQGEQQRGGLRAVDLWTGSQGSGHLDEGSWGPQPGGHGSIQPSTGPNTGKQFWMGRQPVPWGVANPGLHSGPTSSRQGCLRGGCDNTTDEELRANCEWCGLQDSTEARTLPPGAAIHVLHHRDPRRLHFPHSPLAASEFQRL